MINGLISSNLIKSKHTGIWPVIILFALLPLVLLVAYGFFRGGEPVQPNSTTGTWRLFVSSVHWLLLFSLPLGVTIQASMIASVEHNGKAWKQLLTLGVSRSSIYLSKFLSLFLFNMISACILTIGIVVIGKVFGIEEKIEWGVILGQSFFPYLAALPIMAIQLWTSISIRNQAFSISFGTISSMAGFFLSMNPITKWLPWSYPVIASPVKVGEQSMMVLNPEASLVVGMGVLLGAALLFMGIMYFDTRDIH